MKRADSNPALIIHDHFPSAMRHLSNRKLKDIKTYNSDVTAVLLIDKNTPSGEWLNYDDGWCGAGSNILVS